MRARAGEKKLRWTRRQGEEVHPSESLAAAAV